LEEEKAVAQTPSTGIVYAVDLIDRKLFNAAEPAPGNVESEAAADALAFRWQAMANFYADYGMLNE